MSGHPMNPSHWGSEYIFIAVHKIMSETKNFLRREKYYKEYDVR